MHLELRPSHQEALVIVVDESKVHGDARCRGAASTPTSTAAECSQHILERNGSIEQRESNEQHLHEQLLLRASAELRLDASEHCQHPENVTGSEIVTVTFQRAQRMR